MKATKEIANVIHEAIMNAQPNTVQELEALLTLQRLKYGVQTKVLPITYKGYPQGVKVQIGTPKYIRPTRNIVYSIFKP